MEAVWLREFGPAENLRTESTPDPEPGPGQVVVRVAFANITFVETTLRAGGNSGPFSDVRPPFIPGNGVGGVVTELGAGVDPDLVGARVVTSTGGRGGYAERVAVDAQALIPVPDGLGLDLATTVLADGRTAKFVFNKAQLASGERALVLAAGGGVGHLLVQLAARAGARVVAAAGGADKLALAPDAELGVDYREPGWAERVGAVDVVFDGVGGALGEAAFGLLRDGGRYVENGRSSGAPARVTENGLVTVVPFRPGTPEEMRALTAEALAEAASGGLRPVIGQRFPLRETAKAHAAIETRRTRGKTLLVV